MDAKIRYYTDGTSPLSDAVFDWLEDEIQRRAPRRIPLRVGVGIEE
jgi:hypothetical protein